MTNPQEIVDKMLGTQNEDTKKERLDKMLYKGKGLKLGPQDGTGPNECCEKK